MDVNNPLKMILIGIDPYPYLDISGLDSTVLSIGPWLQNVTSHIEISGFQSRGRLDNFGSS